MTTDLSLGDLDHFEEGLVHLADMLELADPRRKRANESQKKVKETGVSVPVGGTYEEWKAFCLKVAAQLRAARSRAATDDARATIDATVDRIEQLVEQPPR